MQYRCLGKTGLQVSVVGLGCNNFGDRTDFEGTQAVVGRAIDSGVNFLDTADAYGKKGGSETYLGRVLGERRKRIVLATKFALPMGDDVLTKGASRRYIFEAVEASLKRLQTDWIDLYQIHFPDPQTPIEETLRALDDLVHQGKVRYIGCANFTAWETVEAQWTSRHFDLSSFATAQNHFSLLWLKDAHPDLLEVCDAYGVGLLPYYPLAGGFLTGKYRRDAAMPEGSRLSYLKRLSDRYVTDRNWEMIGKLEAFASSHGKGLLDLAFAWLLAHPCIPTVIAGATKPEQIDSNVAASEWILTPQQKAEVDAIVGAKAKESKL